MSIRWLALLLASCAAQAIPLCSGAPHFGDPESGLYSCWRQHNMSEWSVCPSPDGTEWKKYWADGHVVHYVPVPDSHHEEGEILCLTP